MNNETDAGTTSESAATEFSSASGYNNAETSSYAASETNTVNSAEDTTAPANPSPYHPSWTSEELERLRESSNTLEPTHDLKPTLDIDGGGAALPNWIEAKDQAETKKQDRLDYVVSRYQNQAGLAELRFERANRTSQPAQSHHIKI